MSRPRIWPASIPNWKRWQIRNHILGLCIICGGKRVNKNHCENHRHMQNMINQDYQIRRAIKDVRKNNGLAA